VGPLPQDLDRPRGSVARTVFVVNSAALPMFLDEISRAQGFGPAVAT
jgi:hypothetical protein